MKRRKHSLARLKLPLPCRYAVEMSSWPITSESSPPEATPWEVLDWGGHSHHSTSYVVKNLDADREYIFRVRSENVHGQVRADNSALF